MFGFLIFLLTTVYFYFEHRNTKEKLEKERRENSRKLFELTILNELSEKIGYSLSSKDIAATIAVTAQKLFQVTSVSYAIIENDHTELTTITQEAVNPDYLRGTKEIVLQGLYSMDETLKRLPVIERASGAHISNSEAEVESLMHQDIIAASYFNIPLVLNNRLTGIVNITSKIPHAYQEEDMSMLYKIVNRAQLAIGRLETVIETEKGKVASLVKSLSSGEIFFTLRNDSLELFTINQAALRFLKIEEDNPQLLQVFSHFNLKPNIITEMKDVIIQKKSTIYRNVTINELKFNIYVTPVFSYKSENVIGVAVTMQDVTREYEIQKIREGFTNMMVHELRAPLTAIKGASELLIEPQTAEEDRAKMRLVIKNASERLLTDIGDMLDSAKIDAGKLLVEMSDSNINRVIDKTVEELSYAASSRAILLEKHLDEDIPDFALDPLRIGQVVANLVSNAIKFSDEHTLIEIYSRRKNGVVEIEVKDHGCGVEKEKMDTLFKPFSQANVYKKREKGTGLGLYISKSIITEHNGRIWLDSVVGEGTSAFFTLPMSQKEAHPAPQPLLN
jgi:signal transduction histidine kinase